MTWGKNIIFYPFFKEWTWLRCIIIFKVKSSINSWRSFTKCVSTLSSLGFPLVRSYRSPRALHFKIKLLSSGYAVISRKWWAGIRPRQWKPSKGICEMSHSPSSVKSAPPPPETIYMGNGIPPVSSVLQMRWFRFFVCYGYEKIAIT